jgi:hypothetical protein
LLRRNVRHPRTEEAERWEYPDKTTPEALALKRLYEEYDRHYGEERAAGPKSRT